MTLSALIPCSSQDESITLLSVFREAGLLPLLLDVLRERNWTEDDIEDVTEEDLYCSLAYQLSNLHVLDYYHTSRWCWGYKSHQSFSYIAIRDVDWNEHLDLYDRTDFHSREP